MVTSMLERTIEIEGLLRIIRDGNTLPETYKLLTSKTADLAECAMLLELEARERINKEEPKAQIEFHSTKEEGIISEISNNTPDKPEIAVEDEETEVPNDGVSVEEDTKESVFENEDTSKSKGIELPEERQEESSESKETDVHEDEETEDIPENENTDVPEEEKTDDIPENVDIDVTEEEETEDIPENEDTDMPEEGKTDDIAENVETGAPEDEGLGNDDEILFNLEEEDESIIFEPPVKEESTLEVDLTDNEATNVNADTDKIKQTPVKKREIRIKSAFSLNDRFLYSRELFDGNMKMFDSTLDFLEGIDEYPIIEDYFYSELEWDPENRYVATFMDILRPFFRE